MIDTILRTSKEHNMLPGSGVVVVAVSGGADSVCLLEALLEISLGAGFELVVAHYNHQLRGEESERDEDFVKEHCKNRGLELFTGRGDVTSYSKTHGLSVEEAARELRYAFLYETALLVGAKHVATAHTSDDNAETLIMNLIRGTGMAGMSGIPPIRELVRVRQQAADFSANPPASSASVNPIMVVRPMLNVSKKEVLRFLHDRNINYVEDTSNSLDIYTRNRIRHQVVPLFEEINPRFAEAAAGLAFLARSDEEYLSKLAQDYIRDFCSNQGTVAGELAKLPISVSGRVIRQLYGENLSQTHVNSVLELCLRDKPSGSVSLPRGRAYREYERIIFAKGDGVDVREGFPTINPKDGDNAEIPGTGLKYSCKILDYNDIIGENATSVKINKSVTSFLFKSTEICGKMTIRSRCAGDKIRLFGHNGTKTLKKLFIERHIPSFRRNLIPIIADDVGVLAVFGLGIGDRAVPNPGDRVFLIDFEEIS